MTLYISQCIMHVAFTLPFYSSFPQNLLYRTKSCKIYLLGIETTSLVTISPSCGAFIFMCFDLTYFAQMLFANFMFAGHFLHNYCFMYESFMYLENHLHVICTQCIILLHYFKFITNLNTTFIDWVKQ